MKEKSDQLRYSAPAAKALLEMMEFMAKHDNRYTLSEIVESLDITSNSAFRIFKEMEQKGYVVKDPVTSTYELTPKLYYLGSSIRDRVSFIKTAQPYMESIKKATRETVLLTRFTHQYDTLVVDQLESSEPIKFVSTVGLSYDSYASAMGKAMLSMLDEKELGVYLQTHELVRKTEYTITDRDQLISVCNSIFSFSHQLVGLEIHTKFFFIEHRQHCFAHCGCIRIIGQTNCRHKLDWFRALQLIYH